MRFFWAFVLIGFGLVGLGANAGWWDMSVFGQLFSFWPLILVFWGLDLVFKKTRIYPFIIIFALLISGLFIYDTAFSDNSYLEINTFKEGCCEVKNESIDLEMPQGTREIKYKINTGAVNFRIDGGTPKLIEGNHKSNITTTDLNVVNENEITTLALDTPGEVGPVRFWRRGSMKNDLNLTLNKDKPISLEVNCGASSLNFDLTSIILKDFSLKAGASSIETKIGESIENNASVNYDTGASSIVLKVPKNIGVKVNVTSGLNSTDFNGFRKSSDNEYQSEGYLEAEKKITIYLRSGASSIEVVRY